MVVIEHNSSNVDPYEVQKFDQLAKEWWDLAGPCKPLHELNPIRLAFIQHCCSLTNQSILDVGCGGGILTEALSRFSDSVTGIDQSPQAITVARQHASSLLTPPDYKLTTVESLAEQLAGTFDIITCMEMLEHVPSPHSILSACAKLLKPNGHLILSTLNRTPKAFLHAIIGAEYMLNILPRGTHEYERFIRPSELYQWANSFDLRLCHLKGISYHLLTDSYHLSDNVQINYLIHFQKGSA